MNKILPIISFALAILFLGACGGNSLQTTYTNQAEKIDKWVDSQLKSHPEYRAVYNDGVVRLIIAEGTGDYLEKGGKLTFTYTGYTFDNYSVSNSNIFATNDADLAGTARWNLTDESVFTPTTIVLGRDDLVKGLEMGLEGICEGEDCYIVFSGKYGFGRKRLGTIPANTAICYRILANEVVNK